MTTTIQTGAESPFAIHAGTDLSANQYYAVKQNNGLAEVGTVNDGVSIWGVLANAPSTFEVCAIIIQGFGKVLLGENCTGNDMLGPLIDGTFGPSSSLPMAKAIEDGITGDVIHAFIDASGVGGISSGSGVTTFVKITDPAADNDPKTAADWPGGSPPNGGLLEVEKLPLERNRRELMTWAGGPNFVPVVETLKTITALSHGLDLTPVEGEREPVGWYETDVDSREPTTIEEVNHYAVAAPTTDSLTLRTATNMRGQTYSAVVHSLAVKLGESVYWDAATNRMTLSATDLRVYQVSDTDLQLIKFFIEDTRTVQTSPTQSIAVDEWAFELTADVAKDVEIPIGSFVPIGATPGTPPLTTWAFDPKITVSAGANEVARSGDADTDLVGTGSASGISFNQDLFLNDVVIVRQYRLE